MHRSLLLAEGAGLRGVFGLFGKLWHGNVAGIASGGWLLRW
ncbi:hypothetical protein FHS55_003149 [Angulomicrobium tetraedrale]|uniref:Uncharacterized protein n=1 Tax=Ancylobacter tetraedralis TaxID=217068 RepID=A0A839ZCT3_9HYPH|nr:hypothetical protein [Ancylobacter tetraedralis]MBB3772528.1 hypothetical protein [Ancylobacter tetraedralis]